MADTAPTTTQTTAPTQGQAPQTSPGQTPNPADTGSKASQQPAEFFEVKVNGKTVKMTRQEVLDHASMSHAANDKFNEAKKQRQEVDRIIKTAKANPIEALMDPSLGLSKDQIRDAFEKWYAKEFIEPETLSADQRRIKELEEYKSKKDQEEQDRQEKLKKEEEEKLTSTQREHLQQQIIDALDKSNLPKTPNTVARIAFYMRQSLLNGWDAPMDMIIRQVKQERQQSFRSEMETSSVDQIVELLGDEFVNKIRRHDLENLRKRREAPPVNTEASPQRRNEPGNSDRISSAEVNRRLRDMRLGKI